MFNKTGCDGIMVGRGALGRPWVFTQISEYLKSGTVLPDPPVDERMGIMLRHISALIANKGDYIGIREARKHSSWYIRDIHGAAAFRRELGTLESFEQLESIAKKVVESAAE